MGLWLEAAGKLAVVERAPGRTSKVCPSAKQVIGPLRLGAFASPGSPLGLQSVFVLTRIMNNPGYVFSVRATWIACPINLFICPRPRSALLSQKPNDD